jgi:uncharacterized protein YqgV (UPF0045/DUF77 family)
MNSTDNYNVNAAIQVVPLGVSIPYLLVDKAIETIRESGIPFEVGPFSTSLEAPLNQILDLVSKIRDTVNSAGGEEILINLQIHSRKGGHVTAEEKTGKFGV